MARTDIIDYTTRDLADGVHLHDHHPDGNGAAQLATELISWAQERYASAQRDLDVTTDAEAAADYAGQLEILTDLLALLTTDHADRTPPMHARYTQPYPRSEYADHRTDPSDPRPCTVRYPVPPALLCTRPSGHKGPHEGAVEDIDFYPRVAARWTS